MIPHTMKSKKATEPATIPIIAPVLRPSNILALNRALTFS